MPNVMRTLAGKARCSLVQFDIGDHHPTFAVSRQTEDISASFGEFVMDDGDDGSRDTRKERKNKRPDEIRSDIALR